MRNVRLAYMVMRLTLQSHTRIFSLKEMQPTGNIVVNDDQKDATTFGLFIYS